MLIHSLGHRTNLFFEEFESGVTDRGDYLVARSPDVPTYFYGNYLFFPRPPTSEDCQKWPELFKKEFGPDPRIRHMTFCWDGIQGDVGHSQELIRRGFRIQESVVLTAQKITTPLKYWAELEIRPLVTDQEWSLAIESQVAGRENCYEEIYYRDFKIKQFARYKRMSQVGLGHWFGAFYHGKLVADLGLFKQGKIARFQSVGTHPDFRRRGACGTLVHRACEFAINNWGTQNFVMIADPDYHAAKIYETVGFLPTERIADAFWNAPIA